jgi:hypothetical protein
VIVHKEAQNKGISESGYQATGHQVSWVLKWGEFNHKRGEVRGKRENFKRFLILLRQGVARGGGDRDRVIFGTNMQVRPRVGGREKLIRHRRIKRKKVKVKR